jgi:AraC-like DNA-binding protein
MTVGEYVQREKMEEAVFLLRHTATSLSEIAAYLNYSSQSYFTQQFKKYTGETPERYRRSRVGR